MNPPGELSLSAVQRRRAEGSTSPEPTPGAPATGPAPTSAASPPSAAAVAAAVAATAHPHPAAAAPAASTPPAKTPVEPPQAGSPVPFDPIRLLAAAQLGWWKVLIAGVLLGITGAAVGYKKFQTNYTASVQLMRRELPNSFRAIDTGEAFKPRQFSVGTITAMMRSPGFLEKVAKNWTKAGKKSKSPVDPSSLGSSITITPEKNTDLITIGMVGNTSADAVAELINFYAEEVVSLTSTLQASEAGELNRFLKEQLTKTEAELAAANTEMLNFSREANFYSADKEVEAYLRSVGEAEARLSTAKLEIESVELRIASAERELAQQDPLKARLNEAREALNTLSVRYTDADPHITEQKAKIESLEAQIKRSTNAVNDFQAGANTVANSLYLSIIDYRTRKETLTKQLPQLEGALTNIQAKLQGVPEKSLRHARIKARQTALELTRDLLAGRQREAELFTENSPGYYRLFGGGTNRDLVEKSSRGKKIAIVAIAGTVVGAAFALFIVLFIELLDDRIRSPGDLRRVTRSPLLANLPDLKSMSEADIATWRFRTWSVLQRQLGHSDGASFVLGIISAQSGEGRSTWIELLQKAAAEREWRTVCVVNRPLVGVRTVVLEEALAHPEKVTALLNEDGHATVLWDPSTKWNAAERARWHVASLAWSAEPHVAVLLELPPASRLESMMLAETVPQTIWVATAEAVRQSELAPILTTIRLADVRIVGSFLNRIPPIIARLPDLSKFGLLWIAGLGLGLAVATSSPALADASTEVATTNTVLSAVGAGPKLAPWQQRLTLGPGDLVNLYVYGQKQYTRTMVPIGPDGRISYLQVQGVTASGLTIDELREVLSKELSRYQKNAKVVVKPAAWRSKKYYLLGTIMDRGAFPLDRPMTIIEATARARGIATGLLEQNTVEIADLPRAFLIRDGKRLPVDFVKLFQEGDLSQNIAMEPGDYIYFPSSTVNEVYVLGSVNSPGTVGVTDKATVLSVITTRGGFTDRAWTRRVLVIRGSLTKPETHIVDLKAILQGTGTDFQVLPKDIVFVAEHPWTIAQDLLDTAVRSFIQAATTTWVNQNIGPFLSEPFVPSIR